MQLYDATLRLGGNLNNTIVKTDLTAPEILVLQSIHGGDAVVEIEERNMDKRSHEFERARLDGLYGQKNVIRLFGAPFANAKLPVKLNDFRGVVPSANAEEEESADTFALAAG